MKANYGVPEIWFADQEETGASKVAEGLASAGLRFALARGSSLGSVPAGRVIEAFAFGESSLVLHEQGGEHEVMYDAPMVGVFCQPKRGSPSDDRRRAGDSLGSALSHTSAMIGTGRRSGLMESQRAGSAEEGTATFFDLFSRQSGELCRFSIFRDVVDSSELKKSPHSSDSMATLVTECTDRFTHARIDRRLMGMQIRHRPKAGMPSPMQSRRKGLCFAGPALSQLLRSISPGLEDVHQAELSSRLAYLTGPLS